MLRNPPLRFMSLIAMTLVCSGVYAQIPPIPPAAQRSIERIIGTSGSYAANESVFKIRIPRTDIAFNLQGQRLPGTRAKESRTTTFSSGDEFTQGAAAQKIDEPHATYGRIVPNGGLLVSRSAISVSAGMIAAESSGLSEDEANSIYSLVTPPTGAVCAEQNRMT